MSCGKTFFYSHTLWNWKLVDWSRNISWKIVGGIERFFHQVSEVKDESSSQEQILKIAIWWVLYWKCRFRSLLKDASQQDKWFPSYELISYSEIDSISLPMKNLKRSRNLLIQCRMKTNSETSSFSMNHTCFSWALLEIQSVRCKKKKKKK